MAWVYEIKIPCNLFFNPAFLCHDNKVNLLPKQTITVQPFKCAGNCFDDPAPCLWCNNKVLDTQYTSLIS